MLLLAYLLVSLFFTILPVVLIAIAVKIRRGHLLMAIRIFASFLAIIVLICAIVGHLFLQIPFKQSFPILAKLAAQLSTYAWNEVLKFFSH